MCVLACLRFPLLILRLPTTARSNGRRRREDESANERGISNLSLFFEVVARCCCEAALLVVVVRRPFHAPLKRAAKTHQVILARAWEKLAELVRYSLRAAIRRRHAE